MLIITPLLNYSTYLEPERSLDLSLNFLAASDETSESFAVIF